MSKICHKIEPLFRFNGVSDITISEDLNLFAISDGDSQIIIYDLHKKEIVLHYTSDLIPSDLYFFEGTISFHPNLKFTSDSKNLFFNTCRNHRGLTKIDLATKNEIYFDKMLIALSKSSNKYICFHKIEFNRISEITLHNYENIEEYEKIPSNMSNTNVKLKFIDNDKKIAFDESSTFKIYDLEKKEIVYNIESFDDIDFNYDISKGLYAGWYYYGGSPDDEIVYNRKTMFRPIDNFDIFENKLVFFLNGAPSLIKLIYLDNSKKRQYFDVSDNYTVDAFESAKKSGSINIIMNGKLIVCSINENIVFVFDVENNIKIAEFETTLNSLHDMYIPNKSSFMILPDKNGFISLVTFYESDE